MFDLSIKLLLNCKRLKVKRLQK